MGVPSVLHPFALPAREAGDFLEIVRAEGSRQWAADDRSYLDGTASLWYCPVLAEALLARGVVGRAIPYANTLAFSPPLVITEEEIDELVEALTAALADVNATV